MAFTNLREEIEEEFIGLSRSIDRAELKTSLSTHLARDLEVAARADEERANPSLHAYMKRSRAMWNAAWRARLSPERRESILEAGRKRQQSKWLELLQDRDAMANYRAKRKSRRDKLKADDPIRHEENLAKKRAHRLATKADPVKRERERARRRAYQQRYRAEHPELYAKEKRAEAKRVAKRRSEVARRRGSQ